MSRVVWQDGFDWLGLKVSTLMRAADKASCLALMELTRESPPHELAFTDLKIPIDTSSKDESLDEHHKTQCVGPACTMSTKSIGQLVFVSKTTEKNSHPSKHPTLTLFTKDACSINF